MTAYDGTYVPTWHSAPRPSTYGAMGHGVKDESDQLQAALNAAAGGALVLRSGATYKASGLSLPTGTTLCADGGIAWLTPTTDGPILTLAQGERQSVHHVGFTHDRSMSVTGIELATTGAVKWPDLHHLWFLGINGSAVAVKGRTVWETTWPQLHARACGAADSPVVDIVQDASTDTNNLTLRDSIINLFHGPALRVLSSANPTSESNPGARVFRLRDCMFHGGTTENNLTPLPVDTVILDGVSDAAVTGCNFANPAEAPNVALRIAATVASTNRVLVESNRMAGPIAVDGGGHVRVGRNDWLYWVSETSDWAHHVAVGAGAEDCVIEAQDALNGSAITVSDAGAGTVFPAP